MTIHYAADRTPPGPARLVAFTERAARDGFVKADPGHREKITAKAAAQLCKAWHGTGLADALEEAARLIEATAYTSSDKGRSLEPVSRALEGMDMHHATIAAALRALRTEGAGG